ncbi:MAG: hypothetical protein LUC34_03485 [Campylobacter sp.]|nr:hypothetical protein [Campylobacter sp.]
MQAIWLILFNDTNSARELLAKAVDIMNKRSEEIDFVLEAIYKYTDDVVLLNKACLKAFNIAKFCLDKNGNVKFRFRHTFLHDPYVFIASCLVQGGGDISLAEKCIDILLRRCKNQAQILDIADTILKIFDDKKWAISVALNNLTKQKKKNV